jgi:hypothetical protein
MNEPKEKNNIYFVVRPKDMGPLSLPTAFNNTRRNIGNIRKEK